MVADDVIDDAEMAIRTLRDWEDRYPSTAQLRDIERQVRAAVDRIERTIERYRVLGERKRA